jgi:hypothetical protein
MKRLLTLSLCQIHSLFLTIFLKGAAFCSHDNNNTFPLFRGHYAFLGNFVLVVTGLSLGKSFIYQVFFNGLSNLFETDFLEKDFLMGFWGIFH